MSSSRTAIGEAKVVGRRIDQLRPMNSYYDDLADSVHPGTSLLIEGDRLVVEGSGFENGGNPLKR